MHPPRFLSALAALLLVLTAASARASVVTVNFDDLSADGTLADGYGGITWGGDWDFSDLDPGYPIASAPVYAFSNSPSGNGAFSFSQPVVFLGAAFSGISPSFVDPAFIDVTIQYTLYLGGSLVATATPFDLTTTPTLYASGYRGVIDEVRVTFNAPTSYAMDDVTYSPVPEPASLILWGCAAAGLVFRTARRRFFRNAQAARR